MDQDVLPPENGDLDIIDMDRADLGFASEVAAQPGGEGIRKCLACGSCSAACPVLRHAKGYDPRRLIRLVILGQREEVLKDPLIWLCSTCYSCHEVCPQNVSFTEISFVLKNMAVEAGHFPPALGAQVDLLREHGRLYEVGEFENEKRTEMGLPEVAERPDNFQVVLAPLAKRLNQHKADSKGSEES